MTKGLNATQAVIDSDKELVRKQVSFLETEHYLLEQIYRGNESLFIKYDISTGRVETVTHVIKDDIKIVPMNGEEIELGAVRLSGGTTEYGDTLKLLKEIEAHISRYLDVSTDFRKFATYYVLLTWLYDRFSTLPYLRFIGDTGCGKSRALDVCGGLCYKATSVSGCITPAPIYRMLKRWGGTMVLDEADLRHSDESNEVTKILNCGFERNRPVIRAVKEHPDELQFLPTFGPKVFATRRRFEDPALEARCLTEIMQETTRDDISPTLNGTFQQEQYALRNKLLLYRLRNYKKVDAEETVKLDLRGIEPRLKQISNCFGALFIGQPEVLADYREFIGRHQRELIEQRASTKTGQVVEELFHSIESHKLDTIATDGTVLIPVSSGDIAFTIGQQMTAQSVGQIIKTLGLRTIQHKVDGKPKRCIVYDEAKLNTLRKRYIPSEDTEPVTTVSMVTTPGDSDVNNVTVTDNNKLRYCLHDSNICCRDHGDFKSCSLEPAACGCSERLGN